MPNKRGTAIRQVCVSARGGSLDANSLSYLLLKPLLRGLFSKDDVMPAFCLDAKSSKKVKAAEKWLKISLFG